MNIATIGIDLAKNVFQLHGGGEWSRQSRSAPSDPLRPDAWALYKSAAVRHRHGSLSECAPLGSNAREAIQRQTKSA